MSASAEATNELWDYVRALKDQEPDWDTIKQEWLGALGQLYDQLEAWLEPGRRQGLVQTERRSVDVEGDDALKWYVAPSLRITFPPRPGHTDRLIVDALPRARIVLGGIGRVDLTSPPKTVMLLRAAPSSWRIGRRGPELQLVDLTEASFHDVLLELIRS